MTEKKQPNRRTPEQQLAALKEKSAKKAAEKALVDSKLAFKTLAMHPAGKKILQVVRSLTAVAATGGLEPLAKLAIAQRDALVKALHTTYAILPEHLVDAEEKTEEAELPFEPGAPVAGVDAEAGAA